MTRTVTILGSTGSVGCNTLDVIDANEGDFAVHALTAGKNVALLIEQARRFKAKHAVIADENLYSELKDGLAGTGIVAGAGRTAIIEAAAFPVDCTMGAITGFAGLEPLLAAIANGGHVAIANKEPLVAAGEIMMKMAKHSGATILPVDSEHNAIFQVFDAANRAAITRIIITASGGPFRTVPADHMKAATPEQALKHPNWSMGAKITIDSATMFNKALEIIEAHHLFGLPPEKIDVLVHPQSVVHSMVEYRDGSVLAQMGASDMRVPIAHALGWPNRIGSNAKRLNLAGLSTLTFERPDTGRFPAIKLAYDCLSAGQAACCAMNAANEVAVGAFLDGRIGFMDIYTVAAFVTREHKHAPPARSLGDVIAFDLKMRAAAQTCILNDLNNLSRSPQSTYRQGL